MLHYSVLSLVFPNQVIVHSPLARQYFYLLLVYDTIQYRYLAFDVMTADRKPISSVD